MTVGARELHAVDRSVAGSVWAWEHPLLRRENRVGLPSREQEVSRQASRDDGSEALFSIARSPNCVRDSSEFALLEPGPTGTSGLGNRGHAMELPDGPRQACSGFPIRAQPLQGGVDLRTPGWSPLTA